MRYPFHIVDVFSPTPFGGNQLAVLPDAAGISAAGMQRIAREFNFAETTFVLPTGIDNRHRVRIFTPNAEVDFAGHPTIGTACALVMQRPAAPNGTERLVLEENVGPISVDVTAKDGHLHGTLTVPGPVAMPDQPPSHDDMARILSLGPQEAVQTFFASVGLPFCFVQLASPAAVDRAALDLAAWTALLSNAWSPHVFFFAGDLADGGALHARMCAPALGIVEDPATGSACAALVGAAAMNAGGAKPVHRLSIRQGVAMGRTSDIDAEATVDGGAVTSIRIGGAAAHVASGELALPPSALSPG